MPAVVHSCSRIGGWGRHGRQATDHAHLVWTGLWPAVAAVPDPSPAARHTVAMSAVAAARTTPCPRWWPACGRRPDIRPGHRSPDRRRRRPGHACRTPAVRTAVVPEAADGQSADRSGSLQVPLLVLKFLYSSSRPALRPAATRRSPGAGLTAPLSRYHRLRVEMPGPRGHALVTTPTPRPAVQASGGSRWKKNRAARGPCRPLQGDRRTGVPPDQRLRETGHRRGTHA